MNELNAVNIVTQRLKSYFDSISYQNIRWPNTVLDIANLNEFIDIEYQFSSSLPITLSKTKVAYLVFRISSFNQIGVGNGSQNELLQGLDDFLKSQTFPESLEYFSSSMSVVGNTISQTQTTTESPLNQIALNVDFVMVI